MQNAKVLIVEDESVVAMHLERILQRLGVECVGRVASGEEAIAAAASSFPDVILMDIRLSGEMDGIEAAQRILEESDPAIVFSTAYADTPTMQRALDEAGASGYILKPFAESALRMTLERVLAGRSRTPRRQPVGSRR